MAPLIKVSEETLKTLNPKVYTLRNDLETNRVSKTDDGFIYVPSLELYVARERTHQGKNWYEAHEALSKEGSRMLTSREFVSFLNHLRKNPSEENTEVYNNITQVRSPWRAEWLDAYFEKRKDGLYILTKNKAHVEKLKGGLIKDKILGINLENWISNPTSQGLPKSNVKKGSLYYWHPRGSGVARFGADSSRADLGFDGYPSGRGSDLGVRATKEDLE